MKSNPAYAELAHRRAVLITVINHLGTEYTRAFGNDSPKPIISEDVFREESEVPEAVVRSVIDELQQQQETLRLHLLKFDFVERKEQKDEPKEPPGGGVATPPPAPAPRRIKRPVRKPRPSQ